MISLKMLMRESFQAHKLTRDIAWSMGGFFILAISGVTINIAITVIRNADALGVFNIAYAMYIVISQFAVWGIHYSVLRHSAFYKGSPEIRGAMLITAVIITLFLGNLFALITFICEPIFVQLFTSNETACAIKYAALGLTLFPLNKVLLAYLNGMREMLAFSLLQGMRYLVVMVAVTLIALSELSDQYLTLGFLIAEIVTSLGAIAYILILKNISNAYFSTYWIKQHIIFGSKSLLSGISTEVNSRIDVLLIGFFLSQKLTGVYSFAAMLVDGLYQALSMCRINFNPVLVASIRDHDWKQTTDLLKATRKYILPTTAALSIGMVSVYYFLATMLIPGKGLMEGMPSLLILLFGLNVISVFVPFDNLMVISGHPGYQAIQQIMAMLINFLLTALLIPVVGIEGAAIGTAAGYTVGIVLLLVLSYKMLGWDLLNNTVTDRFSRSRI
jgi:O-antigen/teichoic acid export membrane protein